MVNEIFDSLISKFATKIIFSGLLIIALIVSLVGSCSIVCPYSLRHICAEKENDGEVKKTFDNSCFLKLWNCIRATRRFKKISDGECPVFDEDDEDE